MDSRPIKKIVSQWPIGVWGGIGALLALVPWWRNHGYVRSFFDYGVAMGGVGRINDGQRPYVDFISPIQAGWYFLNSRVEKMGDGTFQAMTLGGIGCTLISMAVLLWILSRRWPVIVAAAVVSALVSASVGQHTIIWYNAWGVVLLAVAAWAGAIAPVLRRSDLIWHALVGTALFMGGINKINMQLMALGLISGWAVRAGLTGRSGWGRVGATLFFYLTCAIVPILAEMAWTGASFAVWWHNVIALPIASRSGLVLEAFSLKYLFKPIHDYYGPLLLPQIGLIGVILTALTVVAILRQTWRASGWLEKIMPVGCGLVALLGGVVLLATNMDIAYIGLAGWLALLVALWIGYEIPAKGPWFYSIIVGPIICVGLIGWLAAWQGQRSQFGRSSAQRGDYLLGEQISAEFSYLRGTRLPPEIAVALRRMAEWRQSLDPQRCNQVFYGPGTEMAAHIWPAIRTPGLPIDIHAGQSMGDQEYALLHRLIRQGELPEITVSVVQDLWADDLKLLLAHRYDKRQFGEAFAAYSRTVEAGVSIAPIWFTRMFGGSTDSRLLASDASFQSRLDWQKFLGVSEGQGKMQLLVPTNRLAGEVIVRRVPGTTPMPLNADFSIYAQANERARFERWSARVVLPMGQDEILVPYAVDSNNMPTTFTVAIPPEFSGKMTAGWKGPRIVHSGSDASVEPVWFFREKGAVISLDTAALSSLLPNGWRPIRALIRNGRLSERTLELMPGGELWLQIKGIVKIGGVAGVGANQVLSGMPLMVHGLWYKTGRLEVYTQTLIQDLGRSTHFHAWCAEPDGWIVIAVEPSTVASPVVIRITEATVQE